MTGSFRRFWVGLGLLAWSIAEGGGSTPGTRIEFLRPLSQATILGPTRIELRVEPPPGVTVSRVTIAVDGTTVAVLPTPPWIASWDFGDGSRGHRIEARADLGNGATLRTAIDSSPLRIDQVEQVSLVNLYPVVFDERGRHVAGLTQADFRVLENGRPQRIQRFSSERKPLRVALVLDTSTSMTRGDRLEKAKDAALEFLDVLAPDDEGMVTAFHDRVEVVQDLTADRERLAAGIRGLKAAGGTALYDAVFRTAERLRSFDGRRVLVLLSDGKDESRTGLEPGSLHTLDEALNQALLGEVMVFAIGVGNRLEDECVYSVVPLSPDVTACPGGTVAEVLLQIAQTTGGRALISAGTSKIRDAFREVAEALRSQYSLAYSPDSAVHDGKFREIRVTVPAREVRVSVRRGYYARKS